MNTNELRKNLTIYSTKVPTLSKYIGLLLFSMLRPAARIVAGPIADHVASCMFEGRIDFKGEVLTGDLRRILRCLEENEEIGPQDSVEDIDFGYVQIEEFPEEDEEGGITV